MTCYGPLVGYFSKELNPSGSRSIVFDKRSSFSGVPIRIPCGECIGCRMAWRRQWAVRCMHEKRMHSVSSFVTLTYSDKELPPHGSLRLSDLQLFMKRLRRAREPLSLRFFACGEYGSIVQRPHYHLLLFNTEFADMRFHKNSEAGEALYRSKELSGLWTHGDHYIGAVTAKSAAYVAGYVMKKVGHPDDYGPDRAPEFRIMSRRPGIGLTWFMKYADEAYHHDNAILNGVAVPLPSYYDSKYAAVNPDFMKQLKRSRRSAALSKPAELTRDRLAVRELYDLRKQALFSRRSGDG